MTPEFFPIQSIGNGSMAIMAKPAPGDLIENDIAGLEKAGINKIVSLLESHELTTLGLEQEEYYTKKYGMTYFSYPIINRSLPPSVTDFSHFTKSLYSEMVDGLNTLIHCHGGIGRSGIVAAAVLVHDGMAAKDAFELVSLKRGIAVPDTQEQMEWVISNAAEITAR